MPTDRGIITLHLGQCGVQSSSSVWQLFCLEHDIKLDGKIKKAGRRNFDLESNKVFFQECPGGKYVPRAVLFDTEPTVLDTIRVGRRRNLYRPDCLISGKEDAGNVFARGYLALADELKDLMLDRVRKVAEGCDGVQGFMIFRSYGGGTGSGFGSSLLGSLREDYNKLTQIEVATVPSAQFSTSVVEPYNAVMATHESIINADCAVLFDNEALYRILTTRLKMDSPSYIDINRLVAQVKIVSAMSCSLRFSNEAKIDLTDIQTNLVPYPRIHFPMASIAPILPREQFLKEEELRDLNCTKITKSLFNKHNSMLMMDPSHGKYMSCCIIYRGKVAPKDVNKTIAHLKRSRSIQFVDWCPTGFKIGVNNSRMTIPKALPMTQLDTSAVMLSNNTALGEYWSAINRKYDTMNRKRAFWHHFINEGMPEEDFKEFREDIAALEMDYIEVAEDTVIDYGEGEGDYYGEPYSPEIPPQTDEVGGQGDSSDYRGDDSQQDTLALADNLETGSDSG